MEKMIGTTRADKDNDISRVMDELRELSTRISSDPTIQTSARILCGDFESPSTSNTSSPFLVYSRSDEPQERQELSVIEEAQMILGQNASSNIPNDTDEDLIEMEITKTIALPPSETPARKSYDKRSIGNNVVVKRETISNEIKRSARNVKFSQSEDNYLKIGIQKCGSKNWSAILKDSNYEFHTSRTRDSLRVRADTATFKRFCKE